MRDSLFILAFFILGIFCARNGFLPAPLLDPQASIYALYVFMFITGIGIGADANFEKIIRCLNLRALALPIATTIGTFAGVWTIAIILNLDPLQCLTISAGFGYYSLSSIFITQYLGPEPGAIALLANIARELITLVFAPLLYRFFGPMPFICSGGCTTSDTTLPVIIRYAGANWIFPAILHAMILDFSVPFWITFFCSLRHFTF